MSWNAPYDRPLPYEETRKVRRVTLTNAARCLFWILDGSIATAISVLEQPRVTDGPREPYAHETPGGIALHPISQEALLKLEISSITVTVYYLEIWEQS